MLVQVVGALFTDLEQRADVWQRVRGSVAVPLIGDPPAITASTPHLLGDAMADTFRLGNRELRGVWAQVLPVRTLVELRKLTELPPEQLRFDDRLWANIVYDFALAYHLHVMPRDHLLRSVAPLYAGWLASFVQQMNGATLAQVEDRVEQLCLAFESEKRTLISRWRWPGRAR